MRREALQVQFDERGLRGGDVVLRDSLGAQFTHDACLLAVHQHCGGASGVEQRISRALESGAQPQARQRSLYDTLRVEEAERLRVLLPQHAAARPREDGDSRLALVGQVAVARDEDAPDLEHPHAALLAHRAPRAAQQRGTQRGAEVRLLLAHGVRRAERRCAIRQRGVLTTHERVEDRLLEAE